MKAYKDLKKNKEVLKIKTLNFNSKFTLKQKRMLKNQSFICPIVLVVSKLFGLNLIKEGIVQIVSLLSANKNIRRCEIT